VILDSPRATLLRFPSKDGMKRNTLESQWQNLMALCAREAQFHAEGTHPRLLKLVTAEIDALAREMGFNERLIVTRDFRAERDGERITRIITAWERSRDDKA
jgi:hypothetical protein